MPICTSARTSIQNHILLEYFKSASIAAREVSLGTGKGQQYPSNGSYTVSQRQKHDAMMEVYRDRSSGYLMGSTESIWEMAATTSSDAMSDGTSCQEKFIRDMDRQASYFMF